MMPLKCPLCHQRNDTSLGFPSNFLLGIGNSIINVSPFVSRSINLFFLLITALSEVWRAHWRHVIDSELFSFVTVLYATRKRTQRTIAEDSLRFD
jgi:hypothetical protein